MLDSVLEAGHAILNGQMGSTNKPDGEPDSIARRCAALVGHRGEASGLALAQDILDAYQQLTEEARWQFFDLLARDFATDSSAVSQSAEQYSAEPDFQNLDALRKAIESPCHKLFRRLNMTPGGTGALVRMRGDILARLPNCPELAAIESDLKHLLITWFNRGFLSLQRINWDSPASVLEKIIKYEAVHEINGWDDLRNRLKDDRRLFAFFHPALPDDPVIFVEIALGKGSAKAIGPLISTKRSAPDAADFNTATFYSISNCHNGLQGISFGNFLIKQVAMDLGVEIPSIKRFETLSPVPGFRRWMLETNKNSGNDDVEPGSLDDSTKDLLVNMCAKYLLEAKQGDYPVDPVARFHLGNGALLDQIHWAADLSKTGQQRSFGIMVNYVYKPKEIEKNNEAYFAKGLIAASNGVRKLARN
jgi:malonyl-CoA decarboxylase